MANTPERTILVRMRRRWILLQWRRWIIPVVCFVPYVLSLIWLVHRQLGWVAGVLLAPLFMGSVLILLTWWLERLEFRAR